MPGLTIPYQPLRTSLYSTTELFDGIVGTDPSSYGRTSDFRIYQHYVSEGRATPTNYFSSMMQSLHDNAISQLLAGFLGGRKCVAVMGGHKLSRSTPDYASVATLTSRLTQKGFLIASGGGPGAMEATHLGAAAATESDDFLKDAIAGLAAAPALPANIQGIVSPSGVADPAIVAATHSWFAPAMDILAKIRNPGTSLSVPTWHYGHEPSTPFATHIAKYFQNSIREDGLLAIATHGVVYAQGKAGTIQEIFQDAAQNYYKTFGAFSPMVFLGVAYWKRTFPVDAVLRALFAASDYSKYILITDDIAEAQSFLEAYTP